MEIKVYPVQEVLNYLQFEEGQTARGKESKKHKCTRDPHTSLASKAVSRPAHLLRKCAGGDGCPLSYVELTRHLAEQIDNHANVNRWRVGARSFDLATIALNPYVYGKELTGDEAAKLMQISKRAYYSHWVPKVTGIRVWIKHWVNEVKLAN